MTITVAMWSGPRNISTALMYSFGNRPDCFAWDEPFYAFSLLHHGNDHPLRDEILSAYESDYGKLVQKCLGPPPDGRPVFYQKHMTHHMPKGLDRGWIAKLSNAFLIRAPEKVLASYVRKWSDVSLRDIGFVEQGEIYREVADRTGRPPPVVDADDVLADSGAMLTALCQALGIPFRTEMLAWPKGPKAFDGIWAGHWYEAVWRSTGFERPAHVRGAPQLPDHLRRIADEARPIYEALRSRRLAPSAESGKG